MTSPRLLFVDQTGALGGAELFLYDVAAHFRERARVLLLGDGPFRTRLAGAGVEVEVIPGLDALSRVRKTGGLLAACRSLPVLLRAVRALRARALQADVVYLNTPKALVLGSVASRLAGVPFVYHLHDLLSAGHFSPLNRRILVGLGNRSIAVIANSKATRDAFLEAGGRPELTSVVYNGFDCDAFDRRLTSQAASGLRRKLGIGDRFLVSLVGRLAPWKGQHVLLEALRQLPAVHGCIIGGALFTGEDQAYEAQLRDASRTEDLRGRIHFLGFRDDIPGLLGMSDLIAHCSVAPEPFGRVIVEGQLAGKPVVATDAGGAREIIDPGRTGWLVEPGDAKALAAVIRAVRDDPAAAAGIARAGRDAARRRFGLEAILGELEGILTRSLTRRPQAGRV